MHKMVFTGILLIVNKLGKIMRYPSKYSNLLIVSWQQVKHSEYNFRDVK